MKAIVRMTAPKLWFVPMLKTVNMTDRFPSETLSFRWLISLALMVNIALMAGSVSAACIPPVPPLVPESDRGLIEYADMISQDFEQYFADTTKYTICLDQERVQFMTEAREVSRMYEDFITRAEALGVTDKIAVEP